MVGAARLKAAGTRFAALLAAVVLLHLAALQWLAREMEASPLLHAMPAPMFTRLLQQAAPAEPPPPPPPAVALARPRVRHVTAPAPPAAKAPEPVASIPEPIASAPTETIAPPPEPPASAQAVAQAASAASAPASAASSAGAAPGLDSWPADTRLNYRLGGQFRSGELYGSARVQWLRQAEKYEAKIDIDVTLFARLILTSQGEVTGAGLLPRTYEEMRRSGLRGARLGENGIVLNDGRTVPRPPGVQDTASQFVELSHRFSSGLESLEVGKSVSVWLARPGGVDLWTYDVVERETLRSRELGDIDAFHLKPRAIANPRGNITAEMWFAPSLQYLPVRIKVSMGDGTFVDLMVEKIEQR